MDSSDPFRMQLASRVQHHPHFQESLKVIFICSLLSVVSIVFMQAQHSWSEDFWFDFFPWSCVQQEYFYHSRIHFCLYLFNRLLWSL